MKVISERVITPLKRWVRMWSDTEPNGTVNAVPGSVLETPSGLYRLGEDGVFHIVTKKQETDVLGSGVLGRLRIG